MSQENMDEMVKLIALRDCSWDDLTITEKRVVMLYMAEVMSKDVIAWKLAQLWIDKYSRDYPFPKGVQVL